MDELTPGEQAQYDQLIETVTQAIARTMFHHATRAARMYAALMVKTDLAGEDWSDDLLASAIKREPLIHFESVPDVFVCVSEMFKRGCPHNCNHAAGVLALRAGMLMFAESTSATRAEAIGRITVDNEDMQQLVEKADGVPLLAMKLAPSDEFDVFALSPGYMALREALAARAGAGAQDANDATQTQQDSTGKEQAHA